MKNAFLYRTQYIKAAQCKPHPASKEAAAKHVIYAQKDADNKRRLHQRTAHALEKKRLARLKRAKNGIRAYRVAQNQKLYRRKKYGKR